MAAARELQFRLLPPVLPKLRNLEIAAKFSPARAIGGDLYDVLGYSNSRTAIAIGDVSGKGAPAAIYAALVSGILRSHAPIEPAPAEMLAALNYSLSERRVDAQFVSLIYALWDDDSRTLQVANSGLPRPMYCHNGKTQLIEATGLPLGLFDDAEYDEFTFQAEPNDIFVFFSDGILDATNKAGDLFGRTRLEKVVNGCAGNSAESMVKSIFKAVTEHASGVETFDDQTVVAIKVKASASPRK
jgi:sigma-B regulation protein RsbU (phosphoserine phosphatase)